jgi:hypothetical protein
MQTTRVQATFPVEPSNSAKALIVLLTTKAASQATFLLLIVCWKHIQQLPRLRSIARHENQTNHKPIDYVRLLCRMLASLLATTRNPPFRCRPDLLQRFLEFQPYFSEKVPPTPTPSPRPREPQGALEQLCKRLTHPLGAMWCAGMRCLACRLHITLAGRCAAGCQGTRCCYPSPPYANHGVATHMSLQTRPQGVRRIVGRLLGAAVSVHSY